jgi:transposase InsO family protein
MSILATRIKSSTDRPDIRPHPIHGIPVRTSWLDIREESIYECLDRIVPLGEAHLRAAVSAFVHHYHEERPHQGLGNDLIAAKTKLTGTGPVRCHERLGGILRFYDREAA